MDGWVTVGRICARNVGFGVSFGPIASRLLGRGLGRGLGCGLRLRRRLALRCLGAGRGLVSDPPCRGDLGLHIRGQNLFRGGQRNVCAWLSCDLMIDLPIPIRSVIQLAKKHEGCQCRWPSPKRSKPPHRPVHSFSIGVTLNHVVSSTSTRIVDRRTVRVCTPDHASTPLTRRFPEDFLSMLRELNMWRILDLEGLEPCDELEPTLVVFSTTRPVRSGHTMCAVHSCGGEEHIL